MDRSGVSEFCSFIVIFLWQLEVFPLGVLELVFGAEILGGEAVL